MSITKMVLRTVYISPEIDDALRDEAFKKRTSQNDLIRKYIDIGMKAAKERSKKKATFSASISAVAKISRTR